MDLLQTLRGTGAVRRFTDEPVPDEVVHRILDTARFAPNGGNRQAWRVVVDWWLDIGTWTRQITARLQG